MLITNVARGQTVKIDNWMGITVKAIDQKRGIATILYTTKYGGSSNYETFIKVGETVTVLENVSMTFTKIIRGGRNIARATLGFVAPRDVIIRGEWVDKAADPLRGIGNLSNQGIVAKVEWIAQSAVEKELIERISSLIEAG